MGADAYAKLVIGIEVTRTTFFFTTDTIEHECPKGHPPKEGAKFCDQDGLPFHRQVRAEKATPDFARWAEKLKYESPEDLWNDLMGESVDGVPGLGIFNVGAVESSIRDSTHTALGFQLMEQGGTDRRSATNAMDLGTAEEKGAYLTALAKDLGLESFLPVTLMLTMYWSV